MNTTTITTGTKVILSDTTADYRYNWATIERVTKTQVTVSGRKFNLGTAQPGSAVAFEDKGDFWVTFPWDAQFATHSVKADHAEVAAIEAIS